MTASNQIKGLLAGLASFALIGTAIAQGNPPNPAVKSAPTGAGQQSSQQTPMGTTGTPAGGSTAAGSTASTSSSAPMGSGTAMGSSSTSADTSMASSTTKHAKRHVRKARADRN